MTNATTATAKSLASVLLDAQRAVRHLSMKDPQRIAISDACDNLAQLSEALCALDIGERRTSKRLIADLNSCLSAIDLVAGRVLAVAETIEHETEECEVAYDKIGDIHEPSEAA